MNQLAVAYQSHQRTSFDETLQYVAARDRANLGNAEDIADFKQSRDILFAIGRHHAR